MFSSEKELASVVGHELVHVNEKHSYDLLFFEVVKIILWFNPIIYFVKKEIESVHEFLADEKSSEIAGKHFYSQMLLKHAQSIYKPELVHSFALMPLRYRIGELSRKKSSPKSHYLTFFCAPLVLILAFLFSCTYEERLIQNNLTNGNAIKSIHSYFHYEYGDKKSNDRKLLGKVEFDKAGNILELSTKYF